MTRKRSRCCVKRWSTVSARCPNRPARFWRRHRLRILGKPLGVARIDATDSAVQLQFIPNPPIEPMKVLKLVQSRRNYRLAGPDRMRIEAKLPDVQTRVAAVRQVFRELGS